MQEHTVLTLKDFYHLPQLDAVVEQLVADGPGLTVVAGLDPRPLAWSAGSEGLMPSGRSTIFRILMREMLAAHRWARAIVVAESKDVVRVPRQLKRRVEWSLVEPPGDYVQSIADAVRREPELLVVDRLCPDTATAALQAAQNGLRVLSQMDTIFRGADVAQALLDLGVPRERLGGLRWVVAVQRLATLCPRCKEPVPPDPTQWFELKSRYPYLLDRCPDLLAGPGATFFQATGCPDCGETGRHGEVAVLDVFHAATHAPYGQHSLLPLEEYVLRLAASGHLPPEDVLSLEADQLRRTYHLLTASEQALNTAKGTLERKLLELEASNRVLQQRTKALISLQDIGQALLTAVGLSELAQRVCRHTRHLCGAERAILYYVRSQDTADVLAVSGWDPGRVPHHLSASLVFNAPTDTRTEPLPFNQWPPGIPPRHPDVEGASLRAGLRVPLVAQGQPVGVMIVHTTQRARFAPGEVALLQTFAQQAALAIQRAGLIEQLQLKISELEAAQAELVKKERIEQELELARQVQQSVLPRTFPQVPGYEFAACNEPARQVGGDLYDVFSLDADHVGVVIADVSDKGMPAALYMALTRSLLLAEARRERSPRAVLSNVNQLLQELGEPNMFVTVFYGVIETAARRLTYARAGHDPPLLLRKGGIRELVGEGTLLGLLDEDDFRLAEEQTTLAPGDRLVLYTDGLRDVISPDGQLLGLADFKSLVQFNASLSPAEMCQVIVAHLLTHQGVGEQHDDMTMLVVAIK
jgi:serine phosphatase RsbU (regulator of sigma subunit)